MAEKSDFKEIILHDESPQNDQLPAANNSSSAATWWQPALQMFGRLSGWILLPLILGLILGKWLDRKYGTAPWLFLTTILAAFLVSMAGLVKNAIAEYKKIEKAGKASVEKNNEPDKSEKDNK